MNHLRYIAAAVASLISLMPALASSLSVTSSSADKPVECEAPSSSGLRAVYVVNGVSGVNIVYTPSNSANQVTWSRFSALGGGYAEPVTAGVTTEGSSSVLTAVEADMGYIVEEGSERTCFWVVDYALHPLDMHSLIEAAEEPDCSMTALILEGSAPRLTYHDINGRQLTLSREMNLSYTTLEYNEETHVFTPVETSETLDDAEHTIHTPAPLCSTRFTLEGDRFLKVWGRTQSVTSPEVAAYAVDQRSWATRQGEKAENEISGGDDVTQLGGSAPAVVDFGAAVTEAAIFTEWQMSRSADFDEITYRESQPEFTYTFDELGTTYVRFVCDNAAGKCQSVGQTYEVSIGESQLLCPNAFSPGVSEGVNDEWRVSYKSIIEFDCHIFNRWGQKMATLTDPSQGWDGRHGGKIVPAGVYYYVIKARGADGKKYNLSGDINIVGYE